MCFLNQQTPTWKMDFEKSKMSPEKKSIYCWIMKKTVFDKQKNNTDMFGLPHFIKNNFYTCFFISKRSFSKI